MLLVVVRGPADPLVATGQRVGRLAEQQAAQPTPLAVQQEVAQVRSPRLAVAEVVMPLHVLRWLWIRRQLEVRQTQLLLRGQHYGVVQN